MKKKAIEKIPYFGLKKTSRKKDVKYIGVTAVKIVGHEKHLFLEVYRNKKESKEMPMVRIVLTKKDFGTYWPEKEEWTRQKIKPDSCYGRVIWGEEHPTWEREKKENILQSTEDLERIKKFCKANVYNEEHWWEYIYKHEDGIVTTARRNREHKAYMRRQEALADRMAHTKELPEKEILDRADRLYFHNQHYLYYKKHGCWAHIACSKCGGVTDARWKSGISYESQFQRWTEEPREGHYGTCPMCGARGEYKFYEQDGYKSIAEFAQVEYGLWPSTTSRFMSINREYSIDGYSEQLRPEYAELGRSQLEEMLKLPDTDRQMIQPETSREDIRELKRFNKTEPAAGVADDISQLVEKFYQDNELILNAVYGEEFDEQTINRFIEIVNPAGNRSYKKRTIFHDDV